VTKIVLYDPEQSKSKVFLPLCLSYLSASWEQLNTAYGSSKRLLTINWVVGREFDSLLMGNCKMGNCNGILEESIKATAFNPPKSTRGNLVFNTSNRNVADYYEVVRILGEGSMGSVACVRKKPDAVGGSAYTVKKSGLFGMRVTSRKKVPEDVIEDSNSKLYALKSIILSRVSNEFLEELKNEISILQDLDHPNIVKAFEVYESKVNIYLVLQHCSGGDLYSRVPYSEKQSAKIVGKLLSAIVYMHRHNVCHRGKYHYIGALLIWIPSPIT
jgi:serine/threonine protein kinase